MTALALMATPSQQAKAGSVTFDAEGTFVDGAILGGNLTIDTTAGKATSANLTVIGSGAVFPTTLTFTDIVSQSTAPDISAIVVWTPTLTNDLQLVVATSLVGYTGGPLSTGSMYGRPDQPVDLTSGDLTPTSPSTVPEPSTFWLAACGICGGVFAWSRHRRAQRRQRPVTPPDAIE